MAGRRSQVQDVREMIRRLKLGERERRIARDMGVGRDTVRKYRVLAELEGWFSRSDLPSAEEINQRISVPVPKTPPGPKPALEPLGEKILELRKKKVEVMAIWLILRRNHQYAGSYSSVRRFVRKLEATAPQAFVRVEVPPGDEAQADFGYAGLIFDPDEGRLRKAWVFVMTLSFSRHMYAEIVFDQKVETWIALHIRAFEFFGGVVRRIAIDNLKSAITRAVTHDQEAHQSYRELSEHYGFLISPCPVKTPRMKGKVEKGGVHYVKRNALAGQEFKDIHQANAHLLRWLFEVAGVRDHGTLHEKPLERFELERAHLKSLPATRYEIVVWKLAKLHPDCHVVFDQAYYSAPHRLVGQKLLVRATPNRVEIYHHYERVATHARARRRGERVSNIVHYPQQKLAGFLATPVRLKEQAQEIGPATLELVEKMLEEKPVDRLRGAQGILNFVKRYGPARVEAACRRALAFNLASYRTVRSILKKSLENDPLPPEAVAPQGPLPKTAEFARPVHEIAAGL